MRAMRILAALLALSLAGCASVTMRPDLPYRALSKLRAPVLPPPGLLYTNHKAPLAFNPAAMPGGVLEPNTSKHGSTTALQIGLPPLPFPGLTTGIDLFSWGDASLESAAKQGGVQDVKAADYQLQVYLAIFRRTTVIVYGD